ncbi:MAG TPA: sigma-70 family RNA polymerase sigma factor [Bryobacteraceae bacterium]|jgi:RNA polymerase sigma factor (sigma-70 family)|nr:sigma-70 family RNA polymerase sigma factor [Bryobacteraceae bacterium]
MATFQTPTTTSETCETIVNYILAGDSRGAELLYETFSRGLRYLALRYCPQYAEDCMHDAILTVVQQIQQNQLENPAALPGYLTIVLKRTAWNRKVKSERFEGNTAVFQTIVQTRPDEHADPERQLELREKTQIMHEGLKTLKPREREILARFYLNGEKQEYICEQMNLTDNQFRLMKSRSKQKLEAYTAKRLQKPARRPLASAAAAG